MREIINRFKTYETMIAQNNKPPKKKKKNHIKKFDNSGLLTVKTNSSCH